MFSLLVPLLFKMGATLLLFLPSHVFSFVGAFTLILWKLAAVLYWVMIVKLLIL